VLTRARPRNPESPSRPRRRRRRGGGGGHSARRPSAARQRHGSPSRRRQEVPATAAGEGKDKKKKNRGRQGGGHAARCRASPPSSIGGRRDATRAVGGGGGGCRRARARGTHGWRGWGTRTGSDARISVGVTGTCQEGRRRQAAGRAVAARLSVGAWRRRSSPTPTVLTMGHGAIAPPPPHAWVGAVRSVLPAPQEVPPTPPAYPALTLPPTASPAICRYTRATRRRRPKGLPSPLRSTRAHGRWALRALAGRPPCRPTLSVRSRGKASPPQLLSPWLPDPPPPLPAAAIAACPLPSPPR